MSRILILLSFVIALVCLPLDAQTGLEFYLQQAVENSPFLLELHHRQEKNTVEAERLKSLYTRSTIGLTGESVMVPIITQDNGKTSFKLDAQNADKYWGYDLAQSSSYLHAGITWNQPLTGGAFLKTEQARLKIENQQSANDIRLHAHDLEKSVTDEYLLCLLDKTQMQFADTIYNLLSHQYDVLYRLTTKGLAKNSDLALLKIEQKNNESLQQSALESFRNHLADLYIICGIRDTILRNPTDLRLSLKIKSREESPFTEKYRLDSLHTLSLLKSSLLPYRPKINVFIDGGVYAGNYNQLYRRMGMSAGITFSWLLYDGKQKTMMQRETALDLSSISNYRQRFLLQKEQEKQKYLTELRNQEKQQKILKEQLHAYDALLDNYCRELQQGNISMVDYITILRNKIQVTKDSMLLETNTQLVINALNYWNW
jgi:outer membrane protein TolC